MAFNLRLSEFSDLPDLRRISAHARDRYKTIPSLAHVADLPPLNADRFEACRVVVAVDQNTQKVIGFAAMRLLDNLLYLDNISVVPGASGNGVGKTLLSSVVTHAQDLRVQAVSLTTFREPLWNGPWFRKHGFGPMPDADIGEGLRSVMDRQALTFSPATRETLWRVL
ncbi:GNAT family acetyltransferase [Pseudomonas syringae pv. cilantro]|uniref:GNAT family acetyltransferase n=1 Tax=Pseudomonas syringae pv. cilantro TaxID=81035 RepID=A0A0N0XE65_PSESX|nr:MULTISPECIES: GNAT family N-acetyltransferase [Pseudomonas syringae group]KPC36230.1 GNAT family acetyltransferase [Pseudomonas syringae pv. cilantro]